MASYRFVNHSDRARDSLSSEIRHGRSKAQISLHKILDFISSHSRSLQNPKESSSSNLQISGPELGKVKPSFRFDFDLNLKLASPPHTEDSGCLSSAVSGGDGGAERSVSMAVEHSVTESTNPHFYGSEIDNNGLSGEDDVVEARESNNPPSEPRDVVCLSVLVDAAKMISDDFTDDEAKPEKPGHNDVPAGPQSVESATSKLIDRSHCTAAEEEIVVAPAPARSKSRRRRALPARYRDSVMEPLMRLSHRRSTSSSTRRRAR